MIAAHWFRRSLLALLIIGAGVGLMGWAEHMALGPDHRTLLQAVVSVVFLLGFYASGPWCARFLASQPTQDALLQAKLSIVMAASALGPPVVLYDHPDSQAHAVGLFKRQSRIYLTSALVAALSDEGLRGVIAHENAHVDQRHILATFCIASCFVTGNTLAGSYLSFVLGLLSFLALRRYMEFRADAEAGRQIGKVVMLTALDELAHLSPGKGWHRSLCFLTAYPTLPMRITAVRTGRMALI
jgi:heat shock protein HtpX